MNPSFHAVRLHFDIRNQASKFVCKITGCSWPYVIYAEDLGNNMKKNSMVDHRKPTKSIIRLISSKFMRKLDPNHTSISFGQRLGT